jgi:hypothetical protein
MPYLLVSSNPKLLEKADYPWTRVNYGSANAHDFLPEIRDVAEYTFEKETMSWTFKSLPCRLLDRLERIGFDIKAMSMKDDLVVWTLEKKIDI